MEVYRTDRIRNVVLLGHGGAGKTTLTEAMAYANRLQQHVEKENNVVYPLADRGLSDDIKNKIDTTVHEMEAEEGPDFAKGYMDLLDRLEKKYHITTN